MFHRFLENSLKNTLSLSYHNCCFLFENLCLYFNTEQSVSKCIGVFKIETSSSLFTAVHRKLKTVPGCRINFKGDDSNYYNEMKMKKK